MNKTIINKPMLLSMFFLLLFLLSLCFLTSVDAGAHGGKAPTATNTDEPDDCDSPGDLKINPMCWTPTPPSTDTPDVPTLVPDTDTPTATLDTPPSATPTWTTIPTTTEMPTMTATVTRTPTKTPHHDLPTPDPSPTITWGADWYGMG